jgi:hypothetical protein
MDHMAQLHLETPLFIMIALFFVTIMIGVFLERWQEKLTRDELLANEHLTLNRP